MLAQTASLSLADSVAVHDAAVKAAQTAAGWLLTHVFTGLPDAAVSGLTVLAGTAIGLLVAVIWHLAWKWLHSKSTSEGQAWIQSMWARWGKLIGVLLAAAFSGGTSGQWLALLPTILALIPSATFGGLSSAMTSQNKADVSAGRVGLLLCVLTGAALLSLPAPASAASSVASALRPLSDASGARYGWLAKERFVYTAAIGEAWVGQKATDAPTSYGRLGVGWQFSSALQLNGSLRRWFLPGLTWRPETEVRVIYKP